MPCSVAMSGLSRSNDSPQTLCRPEDAFPMAVYRACQCLLCAYWPLQHRHYDDHHTIPRGAGEARLTSIDVLQESGVAQAQDVHNLWVGVKDLCGRQIDWGDKQSIAVDALLVPGLLGVVAEEVYQLIETACSAMQKRIETAARKCVSQCLCSQPRGHRCVQPL